MDSSPGSRADQLPSESPSQRPESTRKPSLLPAFEPLSSSPFPRPTSSKRKFAEESPSFPKQQLKYYPTPVPTSSTGILASSSPQNARLSLARTISTLSERVPLGAVSILNLPANGEIIRMGRSSNSSHHQLSANRLISRVHVQAAYHAPSALYPHGYVEIVCLGWNGAMIHSLGRVHELSKGETYTSENPDAEIMLDVQDARVMIAWPDTNGRKLSWDSETGEGTWNEDESPIRRSTQDHFASSPPVIPRSPVSQSPIRLPSFVGSAQLASVQVYEDVDAADEDAASPSPTPANNETFLRPALSRSISAQDPKTQISILSSFAADDFSDGDEENDPVVLSFGPCGDNLLPRLASFSTTTPTRSINPSQRRRKPLVTSQSPQQRSSSESLCFKESPIKNHVINQLAFSRVHSIPLSGIHGQLPAELKACARKSSGDRSANSSEASTPTPQLTTQDLKKLMDDIPCIGEIPRLGKDAAGKPLESEFYYLPEMDTDQMRRDAVTGGMGGTGLRAVRKQHKQYYWKRPRH
ncbi:uncharacterized protein BDR25DRAFT_283500 [Lindgomyces ingoldianus]|uniref:Uncharacterized protein n=1 Tax=Lindgomyces ingoldianus TaxID=673940 RepID=A0ACB6R180_9PLEO|nr:uncharacterized protein BDR25DRAFT_283500 [Lindgomyces ingoldianus]KAF2472901.1 hypothetical protein BDR25DRAFT_283500 [Lindgomyces ingoldianus]